MKIIAWAKTDTGRKRDHNEDSYLVSSDLRLFAVADGMGGHQGGETASRLAVQVVQRRVAASIEDLASAARQLITNRARERSRRTQPMQIDPASRARLSRADTASELEAGAPDDTVPNLAPPSPAATVMQEAAREACYSIFDAALEDPNLRGMGTTLTAMLYDGGRMHLVHAGDSRAYLFRDGKLEQLTEDHSWIWEQVKSGHMSLEEAKESKFRHIITRSVGFERDVEVDSRGVGVDPGDCFLLCSDGMSNYVENEELERILATTWYRRVPRFLIDLANERGGDDNITVVAVYVSNEPREPRPHG
jgi:serine/threonine protein phosphatase PrpC